MAKVQHTCSGCAPIDASIIETYVALINTNEGAKAAEAERVQAEEAREAAEAGRVTTFEQNEAARAAAFAASEAARAETFSASEAERSVNESNRVAAEAARESAEAERESAASADHTQAGSDHTRAEGDHTLAASDHATAAADHTAAAADHEVMAGYDTRLETVEGDVSQLSQEVEDLVTVTGLTAGTVNLFNAGTAENCHLLVSAGTVAESPNAQSYLFKVNPNSTVTVDQKTTGNRFAIWSFASYPQAGDNPVNTVSNLSAPKLSIILGATENYICVYINTGAAVDVSTLRVYYGTEWATPKTSLLSKSEAEQIITPIATQVATNTANINTEKFRNGATIEGDTIVDYPVLFKSGEIWHFKNLLPTAYQVALFKTADKAASGRLLIPLFANAEYAVTLDDDYIVLSTYSVLEKKFTISGRDASVDDEPVWTDKTISSVPYKVFDSLIDPVTVGFVATNGGINDTNNNYRKSDYLQVKPSHLYRLTMSGFICAYDSDKNVISDGGYSGDGATVDIDYTTPKTCAYVRISARCAGDYSDRYGYFKFYDMAPDYLIPSDFLHWKPLNGKRVVVFGDSIVGNIRAGWPLMLQEKTGALVYNCGFGGCRMELLNGQDEAGTNPFAMCTLVDSIISGDWSAQEASPLYSNATIKASLDLLKTIDFSEIDIVLIAYGTNELGYPQDDPNNPKSKYTYAGATRYSLDTLMTQYKQLGIMLLTPIYRYSFGTETTEDSDTYTHPIYGGKLTDNVETLKEVAQEYKVPCIDMYYQLGINKINRDVYYIDGTHLNYIGLQRYSGFVAQGLEKYQ